MIAASDRIQRAVAATVLEHFGPASRLQWSHASVTFAWSVQFSPSVVLPDGSVKELVVKVPVWDEAPALADALTAGPQEDTAEEFAALQAIALAVGVAGDPGLAAIVPLAYLAEVNAIVMERLESTTLRRRIRWRTRGVVEAMSRTGRWLRLYHESVGGAHAAAIDGGVLMSRAEAAMNVSAANIDLDLQPLFDAIDAISGQLAPYARTHGDFTLANVLVTPDGRVASLDPNRYLDLCASDLARFIVDTRTLRLRALTAGRIPSEAALQRWQAAFLEGYGSGVSADAAVRVLVAVAALERLADAEVAERSGITRVGYPLFRRLLMAEVERALAAVRSVARPA